MSSNVQTFKIGFHMQIIVVFLLKFRTTKTSNILEMLVGFQHKIALAKGKKKPTKQPPPQIKVNFFEIHLSKGNLGTNSHSFTHVKRTFYSDSLGLCYFATDKTILCINEENQTSIPNVPLWSFNYCEQMQNKYKWLPQFCG